MKAEDFCEKGAEGIIWTLEGRDKMTVEKTTY